MEHAKLATLLKHGWNLMSQITMSLKKETCQNMSQHVNVNLTSQEPYGPK